MRLNNRGLAEKAQWEEAGITLPKFDREAISEASKPILSNPVLFGVNLYETVLGKRVEVLFEELIAGPGAVAKALRKHCKNVEGKAQKLMVKRKYPDRDHTL